MLAIYFLLILASTATDAFQGQMQSHNKKYVITYGCFYFAQQIYWIIPNKTVPNEKKSINFLIKLKCSKNIISSDVSCLKLLLTSSELAL